ncbi:MAG: carbohydrate ABC transporter permease [Anaerolineae bacterium]|nr:carbohydrate ABC transporter permease [Anaerolineae bacterium]
MTTMARALPRRDVFALWDRLKMPLFYGILILWTVVSVFPFWVSVVYSLKPVANSYDPPYLWPVPFTLENYRTVLTQFELFPRWVLNSTIVAITVTIIRTLFCAMGGYAFARLRFPGKNLLFTLTLFTMMVPGQVTLIPTFLIIGPGVIRDLTIGGVKIPTGFGLLNNLGALILPSIVDAFGIFMMTQFYKSIPTELEEAAMVDGLSRFGIFFRIVLPISQTALLTLALFTFQGTWNSFMWPLIVLRSPENFTLPVGLQWFRGEYYTLYSIVLAGSIFNSLPIIIIFFLFQRYFIRSVAVTGLKEA